MVERIVGNWEKILETVGEIKKILRNKTVTPLGKI